MSCEKCMMVIKCIITQVYARLQDIDADQAEPRAAAILAGLSFTEEMQVNAETSSDIHGAELLPIQKDSGRKSIDE